MGLPVLRTLSLCTCRRQYPGAATGRRLRPSHPAVSAFPEVAVGSACTSSFSRLARRSLALRPAHSRRHLYVTRYTEGFSHFVTSMTAPVASGWSLRRVGLASTGIAAFSRRTQRAGVAGRISERTKSDRLLPFAAGEHRNYGSACSSRQGACRLSQERRQGQVQDDGRPKEDAAQSAREAEVGEIERDRRAVGQHADKRRARPAGDPQADQKRGQPRAQPELRRPSAPRQATTVRPATEQSAAPLPSLLPRPPRR